MFLSTEILMYLICIVCSCFYGCYEMTYEYYMTNEYNLYTAYIIHFCFKIHKRKRCYHDSRLYLSVSTFILSFSVQTAAIRNDIDTIISTSVRLDFGTASYFKTLQRFFKIFKRKKTEDSI